MPEDALDDQHVDLLVVEMGSQAVAQGVAGDVKRQVQP